MTFNLFDDDFIVNKLLTFIKHSNLYIHTNASGNVATVFCMVDSQHFFSVALKKS